MKIEDIKNASKLVNDLDEVEAIISVLDRALKHRRGDKWASTVCEFNDGSGQVMLNLTSSSIVESVKEIALKRKVELLRKIEEVNIS